MIGIYPTRLPSQQGTPTPAPGTLVQSPSTDAEALSNWMLSLIKTMRADMDNDKLIPPGDVYIMVRLSSTTYVYLRLDIPLTNG